MLTFKEMNEKEIKKSYDSLKNMLFKFKEESKVNNILSLSEINEFSN